jgi:hypothetical protein
MKRLAFLTGLVLVLASVFLACKNRADAEAETSKISGTENATHLEKSGKPKVPTPEVEEAKATVERLIHNFKYSKDAFDGNEEFEHKNNKIAQDKSLDLSIKTGAFVAWFLPEISSDLLRCTYTCSSKTDSILDFGRILIKIDEKIETELLESNKKVDVGTSHYTGFYNSRNNKLIRFIAANPNKDVLVRFEGIGRNRDFILDKAQHEAICQTVELYDALMLLKRAGIDTSAIINAKSVQTH